MVIFFVVFVCLSYCIVCYLLPFVHLLGKDFPLVTDVYLCFCHFLIWYPRLGVVLELY